MVQAIEKFTFDGVKRSFHLTQIPYKVTELRLSDRSGHSLPISCGMHGMTALHAQRDAMIDATVPEIVFPRAYGPGVEATLTYEYAVTPDAAALRALPLPQAGAAEGEPLKTALPLSDWQESDALDYRDFEHAMHEGLPLEYALCQWLMQHEEESDGFTAEQWEAWYQYARTHCPRFDKEQPKERRRNKTMVW